MIESIPVEIRGISQLMLPQLADGIDSINAQIYSYGLNSIPDRDAMVDWLLSREDQGQFPALVEENGQPVALFTGEKLRTRFAARHILTLEAARLLVLLGGQRADVRLALRRIQGKLAKVCFTNDCVMGECAHATIAWMRYLTVAPLPDAGPRLVKHLRALSGMRDGLGGWKRVPFYYTLLVLEEINLPQAFEELRYAAAGFDCFRPPREEHYEQRRRAVLMKILGQHAE